MSPKCVPILHAVTDSISTVLMRGQLAYLKSHGFEPALFSSPGKDLDETGLREDLPVFGIAMRREIAPAEDLKSFFKTWRLLRRMKPVICNAGTPKAGLLVGLAAWITRVPCRIYTLRGLRLETAKGVKRTILTVTERIACFCAHRVICVSTSLRERAVMLGLVAREKTAVLGTGSSNGVDVRRFEPTSEKLAMAAALRENLGIRQDQPVIGFAGRFTRDKGIPELITAFQLIRRRLPEAVLLLVGNYEEGDPVPRNIRNLIEAEPGIYRVGFAPQIELYYQVMNIFVLPTHREGFPNTVLEAQAVGLPVVTTMATGAVDALEDGVTGLLTPVGDAEKLTEAVLSLLSDPGRMKLMGRMGRERVVRNYRNEIVWESLASLYRSMLQERGFGLPVDVEAEATQCARIR